MPAMSRSGGPNFLGAKYAPFVVSDNPNSAGFRVRDVALPAGLAGDRFAEPVRICGTSSTACSASPTRPPATRPRPSTSTTQQGFDLMSSPEAQAAFDIGREPDRVRDAYGRTPFGQRALLARRLVEAGVPFVTLYEGGWDHHIGIFNALKARLPSFDATLADADRGPGPARPARRPRWSSRWASSAARRRSTRTPAATTGPTPCRCCSPAAARRAARSSARPTPTATRRASAILSPENFAATVYTKLGIDPAKMLYTPNGRPVHLVSDPTPIRELM